MRDCQAEEVQAFEMIGIGGERSPVEPFGFGQVALLMRDHSALDEVVGVYTHEQARL
jgi:hypothetical protein